MEKPSQQSWEFPATTESCCNKLLQKADLMKTTSRMPGEYALGGFLVSAFSHHSGGPNNADYLWEIQYRIITELAQKGPCVIIGRCADYILRDKADLLRVFVHADMKFRAERIVKEYGEREASPQQRLRDKDKRRAAYHRFYTDMKWGRAQNYDITLNSGTLGIDKCVEILKDLYEGA